MTAEITEERELNLVNFSGINEKMTRHPTDVPSRCRSEMKRQNPAHRSAADDGIFAVDNEFFEETALLHFKAQTLLNNLHWSTHFSWDQDWPLDKAMS